MDNENAKFPILKKKFPTIGEIKYKIASTRQELEGALTLIYEEYARRGLILTEKYKHHIRISPLHILPETKVFVGLKDDEVVITLSTFYDSPLGLPLDQGYHDEFEILRNQGRKIGEAGYLGVKSGLFKGGKSIFVKLEKLNFICTIFRMAIQYALRNSDTDDACFVTNPDPQRKFFKIFPFDVVGDVKDFGFDELHINPKPAIAKKMNFREIQQFKKSPLRNFTLQNMISLLTIGPRIPDRFYQHRMHFTKNDLYYFFVDRSDVLRDLKPPERKYVLSRLHLTETDYLQLLKGSFTT